MTRLYIANLTKQNQRFTFSLLDSAAKEGEKKFGSPKVNEIAPGQQVALGDFTTPQIDAIIKHHKKYGVVDGNELKNAREYHGMCYGIGKPVSIDTIMVGDEINTAALEQRAQEQRETTAQAIHQNAQKTAQETGAPVRRTEVEIAHDSGEGEKLSEGYETTAPGETPQHN